MFDIQMLPAEEGDCLILTYGKKGQRPHRILIDGGTPPTFERLKRYILDELGPERHFELLIVTHIDDDHIGGILPLLRSDLGVTFGDIWFNAWDHLAPRPLDMLGPRQGDQLGNLLSQRPKQPWNQAFGRGTVVVPDTGPLPVCTVKGLKLTLLSPRWKELSVLDRTWIAKSFKAHRIPGEDPDAPGRRGDFLGRPSRLARLAREPFKPDASAANGSSIAVLAEYEGKRVLLTGDAFAPVLVEGIQRLPGFEDTLAVDAFKLPHHGSDSNLSPRLLEVVSTSRYLISTNGRQYHHPDAEAVSRILASRRGPVELCFNYLSDTTRDWRKHEAGLPGDVKARKLKTRYPEDASRGLRVSL